MGDTINFDYYYGIEAEQFSFYRVPRLLIKDERFKGLSSDAKLLYGLMLDRMSLSMKNGWLDDENRAYIIYTVDAIMEDLGCAKATCVKIMKELDTENGIGLIEKKRRGLGKPDIIYVKNFSTITDAQTEEKSDNADKTTEVQKLNLKNRRFYRWTNDVAEYLEDMADRERQAEVGTVAELLEEIESENLYQVLVTVDGRTLKIVLLKMQGYSTKEIAPLVHLTTGAIYARLDHLRKKLRKIL